jgi:two-component system, OmpR family, osmolarity sensor histidine kinase EnvZ
MTVTSPVPVADLASAAQGARVTALTLRENGADGPGQPGEVRVQLQILSETLQYPVGDLGSGAYAGMAILSRKMARLCSDAVMLVRVGDNPWARVESPVHWTCAAQPRDLRLWALAIIAGALVILLGHSRDTAGSFRDFARALSARTRPGQTEDFLLTGPDELRQTVAAVNAHLAEERARLSRRAMVLSGVSHDLGTPATRLRLRAAMIGDNDLRAKFETDIDRMTSMIESVLTFTRAEMGAEPERELSLLALVETVVAEYQDIGRPVTFQPPEPARVPPQGSVFGAARGRGAAVLDGRRVLITGRPLALERALGNLIDNALKYGRRAQVTLQATSDQVAIEVQDEGRALTPDALARLTDPFARGANVLEADGTAIAGFGMGLTIVSTIAAQHGGSLQFDARPQGLCARLVIPR